MTALKTHRRGFAWRLAAVMMLAGIVSAAAQDHPARRDLDPFMAGKAVWKMSDTEFGKKYIKEDVLGSFAWVSSSKSSARLDHLVHWQRTSKEKLNPTIGNGEHDIGEVLVRFKKNRVNLIEMSIYNRGDDGEISKSEFQSKLRKITKFVNTKSGVKYEAHPATGIQTTHSLLWRAKEISCRLEYAFVKADKSKGRRFRPEFIILKTEPPQSKSAASNKFKSRSDLAREVVKEDNGDVVIKTVPMVDQGQKGYCAVASAERVMRYYGIDVNQHEMAQICNSSNQGTSGEKMTKALQAAAGKYHTRVLTLMGFTYSDEKGWKEMEKVAKSYNRLADKAGKQTFDTESSWIPISLLLSRGDPELLKQVRASGTKYGRFKTAVKKYIDEGVPILWALQLGVFKEEGVPQSSGGHMRLIIGYNEKSQELIYSDSWGAGHELKRMKLDQAYTSTMQLTVLQPSS